MTREANKHLLLYKVISSLTSRFVREWSIGLLIPESAFFSEADRADLIALNSKQSVGGHQNFLISLKENQKNNRTSKRTGDLVDKEVGDT